MFKACACGSPRAPRRDALLISPFYFGDAPSVSFGAKIILSPKRVLLNLTISGACSSISWRKSEKFPARAVMDQIGTLFKAMADSLLQRLHEHAVERKLRPEDWYSSHPSTSAGRERYCHCTIAPHSASAPGHFAWKGSDWRHGIRQGGPARADRGSCAIAVPRRRREILSRHRRTRPRERKCRSSKSNPMSVFESRMR